MGEAEPKLDWKVAEAIERCPRAPAVFVRLRMACVGCAMAPFETLSEAAEAYGLKPDGLLRALRATYAKESEAALERRGG